MKEVYANDPEKQAELEVLREQAKALGVKHHHRAGIPLITRLIEEHQAHPVAEVAEPVQSDDIYARLRPGIDIMNEEQFKREFAADPRQEANRLIRCRVQCMNPLKKEWDGEIISAGSAYLGTFKKFIPFDNQPYHVPQIIFNYMKERQCTTFITQTDNRGNKTRVPKLINEFAIEELPPLTAEEIKSLAQRQAMAAGTAEVA